MLIIKISETPQKFKISFNFNKFKSVAYTSDMNGLTTKWFCVNNSQVANNVDVRVKKCSETSDTSSKKEKNTSLFDSLR